MSKKEILISSSDPQEGWDIKLVVAEDGTRTVRSELWVDEHRGPFVCAQSNEVSLEKYLAKQSVLKPANLHEMSDDDVAELLRK